MDEVILYLVKEYIPGYSITAFRDLLDADYKGLVFSKNTPGRISHSFE